MDSQQGIADVLLGLMASDDEDIVRCAALILANTVTAIAPLCQDVGQVSRTTCTHHLLPPQTPQPMLTTLP